MPDLTNPLIDLAKCALQPIHNIGHIQPHGLLFALSEPDLVVRHVGANVSAVIGMSPEHLLGRSIENALSAEQLKTFRSQILSNEPLSTPLLRIPTNDGLMDMYCLAHRHDGLLIVELEPVQGTHSLVPLDLDAHIRMPLMRMEQTTDIQELSRRVAEEIRQLSGFDRVMIYRFDEDSNGEVTAEAVGSLSVLYLGSRFPESDIPFQARQLFLMNASRSIADVDAEPVPIISEIPPPTGRPLDLTRSSLRTAAPIHLKYLRNMRVRSSMTLSIVIDRRLWGLVACHGSTPHRLNYPTRSVCELVVQIFASQIALRLDNVDLHSRLTSRKRLEKYIAEVEASESLIEAGGPFQSDQLLDLLGADGLISRVDGLLSYRGETVTEQLLLPVIAKLQSDSVRGIASSNTLTALDSSAESYASQTSGALYIGFSEGIGGYLLLLRRELVETVVWAGNPDKAASIDNQGGLHPRESFAAWKEIVRGHSQPWSHLELENASYVREQVLRLREAQRARKSEERVRYMANYDALTGLLNRHAIQLKLEQCIAQAETDCSQIAVLFIDLDHFKPINDRYGHAMGDGLLKIVAKRMQHRVRSADLVGRLGGDEFIIILPGMNLEIDLLKAVERILRAIEKPVEMENGTRTNVTASIGLSRYPVDGTTSEVLINRSDMAMYRVKGTGGNAFGSFRMDEVKEKNKTTG